MQAAIAFAQGVRVLQRAYRFSPDVAHRILHWRAAAAASSSGSRGAWSSDQPSSTWPRQPTRAQRAFSSPSSELATAVAGEAATTQPVLPLCERPAQHAVPLTDLLAWRDAAQQQAEAVGDSWLASDPDGPTTEDLQTELSWLLDDALAALARPGADWRPATWQQVERDLRRGGPLADAACQYMVQLREPLEALEALWQRRLGQRIPLQYLTACAFWRDVVLSVGPGVLIPRPETELMIDFVQEAVAANPALASGAWADLGTGSGALALGVARALPQAQQVYAVDLSPVPLAYAAFNARRLGVGDRLTALQGSWYEPLQAVGVRQLAGIVSNPPYICATDMPGLQAEVGRHEPHLALCGGEGLGVDCLLPICTGAARLLQPGGFLALETAGGEQAHYIADVLRHLRRGACAWGDRPASSASGNGSSSEEEEGERCAFVDVRVRRDLRGVDRFVTASAAP
ncbi:hemK methyltransferase family member 1 [Chlorella sorokiniana]|uniref:HemK methyltransferase family member 1 n=1 Tax=Chlorella sorokiniana TaxID=3076 RepID=A0A2P6TWU1_CHLSO|nr:hemK methyltransferase family member 1 [Chlorella sorokiniana]|eukprot:PRW58532.1 hemK methyltransferase family member 1 [Chlorella sorokiniana]